MSSTSNSKRKQPKSVLDKIVFAIRQLQTTGGGGGGGVSRISIVKYLKSELEYDNVTAVKKALKQGTTKSILIQTGQSFRVAGDPVVETSSTKEQLVIEDLPSSKTEKTAPDNKNTTTSSDTRRTAEHGDTVTVAYRGTLEDGYEFDKATKFEFILGAGDVIKGWDQGILGMVVGSKRRLVVPPHLGYGKRGCKPDIPPNATLHFIVTLKSIDK